MIGVGIVGCGRVGSRIHLPAIDALEGARVAAVADADPARREAAACRARCRSHVDHRALVADPSVEVVAVCTPVESHPEVALAALAAGKPVLVEKPLALSLDDCDRIVAEARRAGVLATVGFNQRFHRLNRQARASIRSGAIGEPRLVRSTFSSPSCLGPVPSWRRRRASGGGVLLETAIHHYDLWRYLTGREVVNVTAWSRSGALEDEWATVVAELEDGLLALGAFSEKSAPVYEFEVCGEGGRVWWDGHRSEAFAVRDATSPPGLRARLERLGSIVRTAPAAGASLARGGEFRVSYVEQWRRFLAAIAGLEELACTLDDGRRAVAIALAAVGSSARGETVAVARAPRSVGEVGAAPE